MKIHKYDKVDRSPTSCHSSSAIKGSITYAIGRYFPRNKENEWKKKSGTIVESTEIAMWPK